MTEPQPAAPVRALDPVFVGRCLFGLGVVAFAALVLKLTPMLLLLFGSTLVAVLLRAIADPIRERTGLPEEISLLIAAAVVVAVLGVAVWLFQREVSAQLAKLPRTLPDAWELMRQRLLTLPFGGQIVARLEALGQGDPAGGGQGVQAARDAAGAARRFFSSVASGLADAFLVLVGGAYLAIAPRQYRDGLVRLIPAGSREPVRRALDASGRALKRWLRGTLLGMAIVGTMIGVGLWVIGAPQPLLLGVLAGLGEFVPLLGPTVAMVPALLLALQQGPDAVLCTFVVYVGSQQIQSNLIVPVIQRRMVRLPPLITIFSLAAAAVLFGPVGVLFAVPMAVVVFVLVKALYLREVLGEPVDVPGERR